MSDDTIHIDVNGMTLPASKGQMLIEVTDAAGIYIPRFCYHEKLSVAANCRMCLVEVKKAPKPLPACATPVADGMKVYTKSPKAISAQRATMEFLLINHPLDCPICDQGGECELQDLAMGFGRDVSRYAEQKRVVKDKNLGPLISTDMTRCIHCTRCVRFGEEVAGIQELGTLGRGENMEIGTYVARAVDHELSGNVIDLCPVGALNSKPFRFRSRSWEMLQQASVSPHDCFGTNIYAHVQRGKFLRVVPRPNEAVNETWIADRDRFSYEGIYASDRLTVPMVRHADGLRETDWESALERTVKGLRGVLGSGGGDRLGTLVSPSATVEELYLASRLTRGLGSQHIDHRLRTGDFRDQENDPLYPGLGVPIAEVEKQQALLLIGSDLRAEVPMLAHRVRKAAASGAQVSFVNPPGFDYLFPVAEYLETPGGAFGPALAALVAAATRAGAPVPDNVRAVVAAAVPSPAVERAAAALSEAQHGLILIGHLGLRHPAFADLRALAAALAEATGCTLGVLSEGANSAGACLAGAVPHRAAGGEPMPEPGLSAEGMLRSPRDAYLLFGIEPESDCRDGETALSVLRAAQCVVSLTPYVTDVMREYAHVVLPIGTFAETAGTFVNAEGRWQSFSGVARPVGEARPGWKVLRVLGNLFDVEGFDYETAEQVRDELRLIAGDRPPGVVRQGHIVERVDTADGLRQVPMYAIDGLVRRAPALQQVQAARSAAG